MAHINLETVDTDGAIREAADAVAGDTRMSLPAQGRHGRRGRAERRRDPQRPRAGWRHGQAGKGAPPSSFGKGDIGILNYALTLEYLESAFYNAASKNNVANGDRQLNHLLTTIKTDEAAHVAALKKALGPKAAKKPKFDFGKAVTDKDTFAATAYVLENTGVHAYIGQAGNISNSAYLLVALSIVTIEARHSGAIGGYLGKSIAPNGPFDNGYTAAKVLTAVKGTGFIKG